jgi:hypothetical protein
MKLGLILGGILWAVIIQGLTGCAAFEMYGGVRRVDTIETRQVTTAPKVGLSDAVYDWLFVDHSKEGKA